MSRLSETHGRQFELLRHFLSSMFDGEWAGTAGASRGQWQSAAIGLFAMMLPAGLVFIREGTLNSAYASRYRYLSKLASPEPYYATAMADQLALLLLAFAVTGLIALLEWQALFPSQRDHLALAGFPVRPRQIFLARFLAVLLFSSAVVLAMVLLPSLLAPLEFAGRWQKNPSFVINAAAEAAACGLGCFFTFFSFVALQGALLNALPRRWFAAASAYLQGALVGVLLLAALYSWSIKDWGPKTIGSLPEWGAWIPPVWFAGLHEVVLGDRNPFYLAMAQRALAAAAACAALAVLLYLLSYRRCRSLLLETPVNTAPPAKLAWGPSDLLRLLCRDPRGQAAIEFMARTLARSRTHRVVWMAYIGGAIAILLNSSIIDGRIFQRSHASWQDALGFLVLFWPLACTIILLNGMRHALSIPAELPANWIFRLHESQGRRQWMSAVERFVMAYAIAPIYLILVPVAIRVEGLGPTLRMTVLQLLVSLTIFEILFQSWQRFPFTCSYRPGRKPLVGVLAQYIVMLGVVVPVLTVVIATAARFAPLFWIYLAGFAGLWLKMRATRREGWGEAKILYEDPGDAVADLGIKELTYGGVEAQLRRVAAGHAGHADSEDPDSWPDARLPGGGVYSPDHRGCAEGGGGRAVSGLASAGTARPAGLRMGSLGEQSPRQVLPADGGRPGLPGGRKGPLGPPGNGHRARHGSGLSGRLREGLFGETASNLWLRLRALAGRRRLDRDLEDELAFHLAMREEEHCAAGLAPEAARAAARRELGNPTAWKETSRDLWTFATVETFWQDLRYGARQLRRTPGFALTGAITLGLGIGATTAVFSMFDAVLWRPIPLPHLEQLAVVFQQGADPHFPGPAAPADIADIARAQTSLGPIASWMLVPAAIVDAGGEPLRVEAARVSPNFFDVMEVAPALGRVFDADAAQPGNDRVALMSDNLWRRRFAADPAIVGRTIRIDNQNYTVTGVMPPGFQFPRAWRDLWLPLAFSPADRASRGKAVLESAGRLRPGRTLAQFSAELAAIARTLERDHPDSNRDRRFVAWPMHRYMGGDYIPVYEAMLFGAALFVLLIACANVANLQFARGMGRWREVAVRAALGAGRRRIVRQLVTESLLIALAAAVFGLLAARFGLQAIKAGIPAEMRRYMTGWEDIGLSLRALAVAFAAAAASGILAGLAPAWRCSRPNLIDSLKEGGRAGLGRRASRLRNLLVTAEMALAVVLLTGSGLMVRSFYGMVAGRASFDPSHLLTLRLNLSETRYRERAQVAAFYREAIDRLRALPGVSATAAVTALPYSRVATSLPMAIEGQPREAGTPPSLMVQSVSSEYFRALRIPLMAGRFIGDSDGPDSPRVCAISERLARRWFPGRSPLGQRIRLGEGAPWVTIAGLVGDILHSVMDREPRSTVYLPYRQSPMRAMNLGLRVAGDPMLLAPAVTAAIRALDREQPIENMATLATLVRQEAFVFAYMAALMGVLGGIALVLAAAGIYGVTAYAVAGQTHEIGIRTALGASPRRVLGALFRQGLWTAGLGLAVGMIPAFGMARLIGFAVWGVRSADPAIMAGIPLLLALSAVLAIWFPARRALRIDPVTALRCE